MDQVVVAHMRGKPLGERPGNGIKADLAPEVPKGDTVFHSWPPAGNRKLFRPVVVRGGNVHGDAMIHQPLRDRPGSNARSASKRTDRRNDMQYLQAPTTARTTS